MQERVNSAAIPSIVTLGTPMLIQVQYAFSNGWGERGWLLPSVIWFYGVLFWALSSGIDLVRSKRWEWTPEALEEKYRYWSDARRAVLCAIENCVPDPTLGAVYCENVRAFGVPDHIRRAGDSVVPTVKIGDVQFWRKK
jgi:hypothetical protein